MGDSTLPALSLEFGAAVTARDGWCGRLNRLIADPATLRVTHLVVTLLGQSSPGHLVPVELVAAGDLGPTVACAAAELAGFEEAEVLESHPLPGHEPGRQAMTVELSLGLARGLESHNQQDFETVEIQVIPPGRAQLLAGQPVPGRDGNLGTLVGVEVDPVGKELVHLRVRTHHGLHHRVVQVPVAAGLSFDPRLSSRISTDQVRRMPGRNGRHRLAPTV